MEGRKGRTGRGGLTKKDLPQREQEEGGGREKATLLWLGVMGSRKLGL